MNDVATLGSAVSPAAARPAAALHELLCARRTIHQYRECPLPEGALERAIEAAVTAPNHRLTEPWRFVRTGPATRRALIERALARVTQGGALPLSQSAQTTLALTALNPAELLIVCQVRDARPEVAREDYAAVACAIQNLTLSLWAEGVGSKWSTSGQMDDPRSYEILGIDAALQQIVGFLWLGYPAQDELPPRRRRRGSEEIFRSLP